MKRRYEITAVVYDKRGLPLASATNDYRKTHPIQKKFSELVGLENKPFLHAEISALIRCRDIKKAHSIFVSRFDKNGKPRLAKPCPICDAFIKSCGIKEIRYTENEDDYT